MGINGCNKFQPSAPFKAPLLGLFSRGVMSRLAERIENFNKAYLIFSEAVSAYNKDKSSVLSNLALVQAYEVCYELAWKVLKD